MNGDVMTDVSILTLGLAQLLIWYFIFNIYKEIWRIERAVDGIRKEFLEGDEFNEGKD